MKLIKKIQRKDEKKVQFSNLRPSKDKVHNDSAPDLLEPFAWKSFFEEAQNMGMKVDIYALSRTNFKIPPMPAAVSDNAMFGASLDDIMERQKKIYPDTTVPNIVDQCFQYILKYGLKEFGVCQSSSIDCEKVKKLREAIDEGNGIDVQLHEHLKYIDVHTVAGLLKQYLREFPLPVIPADVFDMLVSSLNRGSEEVRKAIHLLPRNSYNLLDKLFYLFSEIYKNDSYNDTDAATLAESFGPVLMWRNAITGGIDMNKTREITNFFIVNYSLIFSKGTNVRPALGQGYLQPNSLSKSASLSTLSYHSNPSSTVPPSPSSRSSPSKALLPQPSPSDPSRSSSGAPQTNYMLELYRNIKEGEEEESDEEGEEEEGMERKRGGNLPVYPSSPALINSREITVENGGEEGRMDRKDKGKMPVGGGGMGMRKSVSENLANKYTNNGNQKKGGFGQFLKKIELKKKT
jgi:hypothetical protein